ncbi:MAG: hypothetical protein IJC38_02645 [Erysipelotrichaceae bacterium]|nr:hypothetical protein [Erysipelotrichaceae bacterium]
MKRCFVLLILLCLSVISIEANSAQYWWSGSEATGIITDGNSPIEVIHEKLVFELHDFPGFTYGSFNEQYSSSVTAEYTFLNPVDETVFTRLMFPYGLKPDYIPENNQDTSIQIAVDGKPIDYQIRHTYSRNLSEFNLDTDLNRLQDSFQSHEFYVPHLPVTEITVKITELDDETYPSARIDYTFDKSNDDVKIFLPYAEGLKNDESNVSVRKSVQKGDHITLYLFGKADEQLLQPVFYSNGGCTIQIDGKTEIISSHTMTLMDFAMAHYPKDSSILEHDWYNAFVDMISSNTFDLYIGHLTFDLSHSLLQWIDYTIQIEPHSTLIHSVTAPFYPDVNESYEPAVYSYTYLLSPAKSWTSFKNLEIEIHTDSFLKNPSLQGFEKSDAGYQSFMESLPDCELTFDLCAAQFPKKKTNFQYIPMILLGMILHGFPVFLIVLFVLFFIKSKINR